MTIPLNRIVAFVGPFVSVFAAGIATWLVAKANVLGIGGLDEANLATQVAGALTFVLVAVLSWVGQSRWLTGVQVALRGDAQVASAALTGSAASPPEPPRQAPPQHPVPPQPPRAAPAQPPRTGQSQPVPAPAQPPRTGQSQPAPAPAQPPPTGQSQPAPAPAQPPPAAAPQPPGPAAAAPGPPPPSPPLDVAAGELAAPTVVDEALPEDAPAVGSDDLVAAGHPEDPLAAPPSGDAIPDGTPDELRPVMPTEVPLQGEPDEHDDKDGES